MLSNRELFSAKAALQGKPRDAFPDVSRELLAEGHDGPAIRQLAALEGAGSWTDGPVLNQALAELALPQISRRLAALLLAQDLARNTLSGAELPFPSYPAMLYRLWAASDYIDDLAFVDNYDPHWSVYFENENAATTALKLALERLASLDLSGGEPAPPPPRPRTFRSLIAPIQAAEVSGTAPAVRLPVTVRPTFRERWRAARKDDKDSLVWIGCWGLVLIVYEYCRAMIGPRVEEGFQFVVIALWIIMLSWRLFRDKKFRASVSRTWTSLRRGRITGRSIWRAFLRRRRGVPLR
jgi:hypothetical protein